MGSASNVPIKSGSLGPRGPLGWGPWGWGPWVPGGLSGPRGGPWGGAPGDGAPGGVPGGIFNFFLIFFLIFFFDPGGVRGGGEHPPARDKG